MPQILEIFKDRFVTTHEVEVIQNREKSFKEVNVTLPWYCTLLPQDQWRIVQEGRPFDTPWIIARPKNGAK